MDLAIKGRTALVCASSRGLGLACARALSMEGVDVFINGRNKDFLAKVAAELRQSAAGFVTPVEADVSTIEGQRLLIDACPSPDILVNNNSGPEPKGYQELDREIWLEAVSANMIAPLMLIRACLPKMIERRFGRIINITSAMVTTPRPHMTLSAGARAGLTAAVKGMSFDVARHNVTMNNILPERFDTARQHEMALAAAKREKISYEEARARQVQSIAAKRMGDPAEFGALCAFLCSNHAGFISGQNFHLDGGSYPALI